MLARVPGVRVIAFEPNARNLHLLTTTLFNLAKSTNNTGPVADLASRVLVVPVGVGDRLSKTKLAAAYRNYGDSRMAPPKDAEHLCADCEPTVRKFLGEIDPDRDQTNSPWHVMEAQVSSDTSRRLPRLPPSNSPIRPSFSTAGHAAGLGLQRATPLGRRGIWPSSDEA